MKKSTRHSPLRPLSLPSLLLVISAGLLLVLSGGLLLVASRHKTAARSPQVAAIESLNDQLLPIVSKYYAADKPDTKAQLLKQAEDLAKQREQKMLQLVQDDPAAVEQATISNSVRSQLPSSVSTHIEESAVLSGQLITLHSDGKTEQDNHYYFYLDTGHGRVALHLPAENTALVKKTKSKVRVSGIKIGTQMALGGSGSVQTTSGIPSTQNVAGPKKVAVLIFSFSNNTAQPITTATAQSTVFTGAASVNNYYQTATFGKMSLLGKLNPAGDVFGGYKIASTNTTCDVDTWATQAKAQAQSAGVDLSGYDDVVMVFPYTSACGWAGMAELSGSDVWINGASNFTGHPITHELGHNYGLMHASAQDCTNNAQRVMISFSCTYSEYGDFFDPMGNLGFFHFNTFNKGRLGVYAASNTQTVASNGTYTIMPEDKPTSGVVALRVPVADKFYYLEYRTTADNYDFFAPNDPVVNGVSIRIAPDYGYLDYSYLLDGTPNNTSSSDRALPVGQSFTDSTHGITIKTVSVAPSGATVQITLTTPVPADTNPPSAPANLSGVTSVFAATGLPFINLSWTAATDNIGVTGYDVYRNGTLVTGSEGYFLSPTSFVDKGITYATTYTYYVKARDGAGNVSAASNPLAVTSIIRQGDTQPPSAPTALTTQSVTASQINLTWQASTDNTGVAGYSIMRNGVKIASSTTTSFGDATVNPDTSYTYTVTAFDAAGNISSPSNAVTIKTPPSMPPPAPTGGVTGVVRLYDKRSKSWAPAPGATVSIMSRHNAAILQSTTTDTGGGYLFNGLAGGSYQLEVSVPGLRTARSFVDISAGSVIIENVDLR